MEEQFEMKSCFFHNESGDVDQSSFLLLTYTNKETHEIIQTIWMFSDLTGIIGEQNDTVRPLKIVKFAGETNDFAELEGLRGKQMYVGGHYFLFEDAWHEMLDTLGLEHVKMPCRQSGCIVMETIY